MKNHISSTFFNLYRDPMKTEEKVEKTNSEENKEESEDEENVPSTSKAEKDKMVEGQQKKKVEIAKIKVKLNILRDDLENAIRDKDFLKAQDLQLDVDDLDSKLINLNEELALMIIPPSVEKRIKTKARTEASAPAETQQGMQQILCGMKKFLISLIRDICLHQLYNKKYFSDLFYSYL